MSITLNDGRTRTPRSRTPVNEREAETSDRASVKTEARKLTREELRQRLSGATRTTGLEIRNRETGELEPVIRDTATGQLRKQSDIPETTTVKTQSISELSPRQSSSDMQRTVIKGEEITSKSEEVSFVEAKRIEGPIAQTPYAFAANRELSTMPLEKESSEKVISRNLGVVTAASPTTVFARETKPRKQEKKISDIKRKGELAATEPTTNIAKKGFQEVTKFGAALERQGKKDDIKIKSLSGSNNKKELTGRELQELEAPKITTGTNLAGRIGTEIKSFGTKALTGSTKEKAIEIGAFFAAGRILKGLSVSKSPVVRFITKGTVYTTGAAGGAYAVANEGAIGESAVGATAFGLGYGGFGSRRNRPLSVDNFKKTTTKTPSTVIEETVGTTTNKPIQANTYSIRKSYFKEQLRKNQFRGDLDVAIGAKTPRQAASEDLMLRASQLRKNPPRLGENVDPVLRDIDINYFRETQAEQLQTKARALRESRERTLLGRKGQQAILEKPSLRQKTKTKSKSKLEQEFRQPRVKSAVDIASVSELRTTGATTFKGRNSFIPLFISGEKQSFQPLIQTDTQTFTRTGTRTGQASGTLQPSAQAIKTGFDIGLRTGTRTGTAIGTLTAVGTATGTAAFLGKGLFQDSGRPAPPPAISFGGGGSDFFKRKTKQKKPSFKFRPSLYGIELGIKESSSSKQFFKTSSTGLLVRGF